MGNDVIIDSVASHFIQILNFIPIYKGVFWEWGKFCFLRVALFTKLTTSNRITHQCLLWQCDSQISIFWQTSFDISNNKKIQLCCVPFLLYATYGLLFIKFNDEVL